MMYVRFARRHRRSRNSGFSPANNLGTNEAS